MKTHSRALCAARQRIPFFPIIPIAPIAFLAVNVGVLMMIVRRIHRLEARVQAF